MDLGQARYIVQIKSRVSKVQMECILKKRKKNIRKQKKKRRKSKKNGGQNVAGVRLQKITDEGKR